MRQNIVAGNWKMNNTLEEGIKLAKEVSALLEANKPNCKVVLGTPFIHLAEAVKAVNTDLVGISAQDCADKESGAYTGETSAAMIKSTGAEYVILGHSERRTYYGETNAILKDKTDLALANGLTPIFCIGEVLEESVITSYSIHYTKLYDYYTIPYASSNLFCIDPNRQLFYEPLHFQWQL